MFPKCYKSIMVLSTWKNQWNINKKYGSTKWNRLKPMLINFGICSEKIDNSLKLIKSLKKKASPEENGQNLFLKLLLFNSNLYQRVALLNLRAVDLILWIWDYLIHQMIKVASRFQAQLICKGIQVVLNHLIKDLNLWLFQ